MDFDIYKILAGGGFDSPRIVYNKEFMKFAEMMNKLAKAVDIDKNGHLIIKDKNGKLKLDLNQFIIESETKPQPIPDPEPTPTPTPDPEPEPEPETCPLDEIWYTTTDEQLITFVQSGWGANVVSNTYENGKGIIKFDNDVIYCASNAFNKKTTLETIILPNNLTTVSGFSQCTNLKSVKLPENATGVGGFSDCSNLTKIIIPNNVKSIYNAAFFNCSKLTDIIIGINVVSVGGSAFHSCPNLSSITILNPNPPSLPKPTTGENYYCNSNAINSFSIYHTSVDERFGRTGTSVNKNCPMYVPAESVELYQQSDWNKYFQNNATTSTRNKIYPIE